MKHWVRRLLPPLAAGLLLFGGLAYLQVLDAERDLLAALCAYSSISIAILIAFSAGGRQAKVSRACMGAAALFVAVAVLRAIYSAAPYTGRTDLYLALGAFAVYSLTALDLTSPSSRIALIIALLAFAVVHVVVGLVQAGLAQNYTMLIPSLAEVRSTSDRGAGLYVDPDHLAGLLELLGILGLGISCWSRRRGWIKVIVAYLTGVVYLGLILTASRGGYLSVAVSLAVFAFLSLLVLARASRAEFVRYGGGGALLLVAIVAAAIFLMQQNASLRLRLQNVVTTDDGRIALWQLALRVWQLHPVLGTGSGTYLFYAREFRPESMLTDPTEVHNDYLHLLCEYGIVGTVAFSIFLGTHLRRGWQTFAAFGPTRVAGGGSLLSDRVALTIGCLSALAACATHSAVDFNMHIPANALVVAFAFGVLANPAASFEVITKSPGRVLWPWALAVAVALVLILQAVRLGPGEYYAEKARVALRDENPVAAISLAEEGLRFERNNPNIFFYFGRALSALARRDEKESQLLLQRALAAFEKAHSLAPLDGTYPLEMGSIYDRLHRFAEAEWMYSLARQREPHSPTLAGLYELHLQAWREGGTKIMP